MRSGEKHDSIDVVAVGGEDKGGVGGVKGRGGGCQEVRGKWGSELAGSKALAVSVD